MIWASLPICLFRMRQKALHKVIHLRMAMTPTTEWKIQMNYKTTLCSTSWKTWIKLVTLVSRLWIILIHLSCTKEAMTQMMTKKKKRRKKKGKTTSLTATLLMRMTHSTSKTSSGKSLRILTTTMLTLDSKSRSMMASLTGSKMKTRSKMAHLTESKTLTSQIFRKWSIRVVSHPEFSSR